MIKRLFLFLLVVCGIQLVCAQKNASIDRLFTTRGIAIALPPANEADCFIDFVKTDMIPGHFNTLILRIDWMFNYTSYPELTEPGAWSLKQIKSLVSLCKENNVKIVPQINLLGHQSWADKCGKLLQVFPEFDETPHVKMPEVYKWPNADGLYCKSYCPNHPDLHKVIFSCVDEVMNAFEATDFHAGMDEVFYIADDSCSRCKGLDPAVVYAQEVNRVRNYLVQSKRKLWIWGDRLLDGDVSGLGMWEGSCNNTARAIDLINQDVVICDWHYLFAEPSVAYFALKGFNVLSCSWNNASLTEKHLNMIEFLHNTSSPVIAGRLNGYIQTVWTSFSDFKQQIQNNIDSGESYNKVKSRFAKLY